MEMARELEAPEPDDAAPAAEAAPVQPVPRSLS